MQPAIEDIDYQPTHGKRKGRSSSYEKKLKGSTFIADTFKKELKKGHFLDPAGDHIARYGKGFSNLLQMAATPQTEQAKGVNYQHGYGSAGRGTISNDGDSIMTHNEGGEGTNDEMLSDSRAAFGYYRPEIKHTPDPLTYKEAVKKYRQHAEPHMGEQIKNLKKIGMGNMIARVNKPYSHARQRSDGNDMTRYLGVQGGAMTSQPLQQRKLISSVHGPGGTHTRIFTKRSRPYETATNSVEMRSRAGRSTMMRGEFPNIANENKYLDAKHHNVSTFTQVGKQ